MSFIDMSMFAGGLCAGMERGHYVTLDLTTHFLARGQAGKPLDAYVELVKQTRDAHFNEELEVKDEQGQTVKKKVNNTLAVASLGGATMDNEWNYLHCKLMRALGVVFLENQARI